MNKTIYLILITTLTLFSRQNLFIIKSRDGEVLSSKSIEHRRNIYFDSIMEDREVISVAHDG